MADESLREEAAELARLRAFALKCFDGAVREGGDLCGGDVQDWLLEAGVIRPERVTEACGEGCSCEGWDDFPQDCLRLTEQYRGDAKEEG